MPFESLAKRLDALPLVICGPILRRTEDNSVSVWIACKKPVDLIELGVYKDETKNETVLFGWGETRKFGENLYIAVVTATLDLLPGQLPLLSGVVYTYDMYFTIKGEKSDFSSKKILSENGNVNLGYGTRELPSFCLPADDINHLNIVHGSCRKPHGGKADALKGLDTMLEKWAEKPLKRPQLLCLHGDQIYADEVADLLLYMLMDAESVLMWNGVENWDLENIHGAKITSMERLPFKHPWPNYKASNSRQEWLAPGYRKIIVAETPNEISENNLSTHDAESHLISLGEFYMMYLFVWSDILWPKDLPRTELLGPDGGGQVFSNDKIDVLNKPEIGIHKRYEKQYKAVNEFRSSLPAVRKALANIPSYMIFDDHEFTDDPFLTAKWSQVALKKGTLSRRILQNGFAAYTIFQDWGNNPNKYTKGISGGAAGASLFNDLELLVEKRGVDDAFLWEKVGEQLLPKLQSSGSYKILSSGFKWHYHIDFNSFRLIALNTRTQREFTSPENPSMLIRRSKMDDQLAMGKERPQGFLGDGFFAPLTIVLSPAPILGNIMQELGQEGLRSKSKIWMIKGLAAGMKFEPTGMYNKDQEAWSFNQNAFQTLLKKFLSFKRVLILSGDIHTSHTCQAYYLDNRTSSPKSLVVGQLNSSALKNSTSGTHQMASNSLVKNNQIYNFYCWEKSGKYLEKDHGAISIVGRQKIRIPGNPAILMITKRRITSYVSSNPSIKDDFTSFPETLIKKPEWRYRIYFNEDPRLGATRGPPAVPVSLTAASPKMREAKWIMSAHKLPNMVVGYDTICLVTFNWPNSGPKEVTHQIWYDFKDFGLHPYTEHQFIFDPPVIGDSKLPPDF